MLVQCSDCGQREISDRAESCPKCGRLMRRRLDRWAFLIAIASVLGSLAAVALNYETFAVVQRPYIGIIEGRLDFQIPPPEKALEKAEKMFWTFVVTNTGSRPGWVQIVKHKAWLVRGKVEDVIPEQPPEGRLLLLPGQRVPIRGVILNEGKNPRVADVTSGAAQLFVDLDLQYWNPQAPGRKFRFWVRQRYDRSFSPGFVALDGDAN